jgi:hypothetical protein
MTPRTKCTALWWKAFVLLAALSAGLFVYAQQQEKVVSSYGQTNQDMTFSQIKAARMAVKTSRAKEHLDLLQV